MTTSTTFNPAHPAELIGEFSLYDEPKVNDVLANAFSAQADWSATASRRADALDGWATAISTDVDQLALLIAREVGKPIREARAEVDRGIRILRYYAQAAYDGGGRIYPSPGSGRLEVERVPLGTVLVITPWNFPVAIPLWKIAPALAWGNTVLFRPSSLALATAEHLCRLAPAQLTANALHLIPCGAEVAERLVDDDRVAGVSFTGSTRTGKRIVQAVVSRGGAVQAEMGGQNASIVLGDADLEHAARIIADASMGYAGQKCTATSRVIVERSVAEPFAKMLAAAITALPVGDPVDSTTVVGPLVSEEARTTVAGAVEGAVARGAEPLDGWGRGGRRGVVLCTDAPRPSGRR